MSPCVDEMLHSVDEMQLCVDDLPSVDEVLHSVDKMQPCVNELPSVDEILPNVMKCSIVWMRSSLVGMRCS
jgi:hypothetical protein